VLIKRPLSWDISLCSPSKVIQRFGCRGIRSDVTTAVLIKRPVAWDITPCNPSKVIRRFGCRDIRFDVPTAVLIKRPISWDITPCSPSKIIRRFGQKLHLHIQGRKIRKARNEHKASNLLSAEYTALYPGRQVSSLPEWYEIVFVAWFLYTVSLHIWHFWINGPKLSLLHFCRSLNKLVTAWVFELALPTMEMEHEMIPFNCLCVFALHHIVTWYFCFLLFCSPLSYFVSLACYF
jgi:hypothetical protein